ncbi:MAG: Stk1 family PASTA domain-containing Ser/Thr kinase [Actinobacteria bacterium]|nr:Stk1 family PASTA domain-containing Ser/Thr kinase [Actinomycetota bacterium]
MPGEKNNQKPPDMPQNRLTGTVINKRYNIQYKIASGGMAEIYAGQDMKLHKKVAIKILNESYSGIKSFTARFQREAQILSRLKSPNIISVYDFGEFNGMYYIVLEFVDGASLKELIDKNGAITPGTAANYCIQICNALELAHDNNLIHRDIKPQNILLDKNGLLKVTDFGIAKFTAADITKTVNILGTAHYLSPEQAQGKALDNRTDIYSLGILMYEMLTADVPFRGGSSIDISIRHISEKPQAPSEINSSIPPGIEAIIMKCLEKNPDDRYSNIANLKIDLENFISNRPLSFENIHKNGYKKNGVIKGFYKSSVDSRSHSPAGLKDYYHFNTLHRKIITGLIYAAAVMAFLFITFLILFLLAQTNLKNIIARPETLIVPQLENTDFFSAEKILSGSGLLLIKKSSLFSEEIIKDYIIKQEPPAGTEVEKNTAINVTVSLGTERITVTVPNVLSLNKEDAEEILKKAGLAAGKISEQYSDIYKSNTIIGQSPLPMSEVAENSTVDLKISAGAELITVPDFKGYDYYFAKSNLEALGLNVITKKNMDSNLSPGTVIGTYPGEGSTVYKNTYITLFISTNEELIQVPDLAGLNFEKAVEILGAKGIFYEINYIDVNYAVQENIIIAQFPEPQDFIHSNDKIIIFVGRSLQ